MFANREEAGRKLGEKLARFKSENPCVLRIWSAISSQVSKEIVLPTNRVTALKFSADGAYLAVRAANGNNSTRTRVFDATSGAEWPLPDTLRNNAVLAFHPKKPRVAIGTGGSVAIFEQLRSDFRQWESTMLPRPPARIR